MIKLPAHDGELLIMHNAHKNQYNSVEEHYGQYEYEFTSPEQWKLAIETDSVWCIYWFPHTPVMSYSFYAATLKDLMAAVYDFMDEKKIEEFRDGHE